MGYVIKGKVAFGSDEGEEVVEAGEAYFAGPGHTPVLYAGTEVVEFSPTEELGTDVRSRDQEHGGDGGHGQLTKRARAPARRVPGI